MYRSGQASQTLVLLRGRGCRPCSPSTCHQMVRAEHGTAEQDFRLAIRESLLTGSRHLEANASF